MKFVNSIPFGRFGPRGFCRDEAPTTHYMRGALPLCAPHEGVLRPAPRVTFSPMRKSPKNLPEGFPLWVLP